MSVREIHGTSPDRGHRTRRPRPLPRSLPCLGSLLRLCPLRAPCCPRGPSAHLPSPCRAPGCLVPDVCSPPPTPSPGPIPPHLRPLLPSLCPPHPNPQLWPSPPLGPDVSAGITPWMFPELWGRHPIRPCAGCYGRDCAPLPKPCAEVLTPGPQQATVFGSLRRWVR